MRKLLFFLLVVFFVIPLITHQVSATNISQKPQIQNLPNFLGQDHNYSITFRGNGETIATLRVIFSNFTDDSLTTLSLRVPKVDPKDISVYQVIRELTCIRFQRLELNIPLSLQSPTPPPVEEICEEYQQPDYYQYWDSQSKYKKADYKVQGDTINITLPEKIEPNAFGSFILYFRALGYAKKNIFGAYDFTFETLKVDDKIRNLQVGISTDTDIFLRGEQGKVDYRWDEGLISLKAVGTRDEAVKSPQLDSFYQQIGQGSIVKNAYNLQPLDSYILKGSFAPSRFSLYAKDIITLLVIIISVAIILILLTRFIVRKLKFVGGEPIRVNKAPTYAGFNIGLFAGVFGLSFVISILILGYTIFVFLLQQFINSSYYYQYNGFIFIFLIIISIGIYSILLLAPPMLLAMKKGVKWAIALSTFTIGWLLLYLVIFIVFTFLFSQNQYIPVYGVSGGPVKIEKIESNPPPK